MSATYRLFERFKAHKSLASNNQGALALGIVRQTVTQWKNGANAEPEMIERMAKAIGEDPLVTILEAYSEREKGASARVLEKLAKRFAAVACALLVLSGFSLYFNGLAYGISHNIVYIM